jgi:hypothetical protein
VISEKSKAQYQNPPRCWKEKSQIDEMETKKKFSMFTESTRQSLGCPHNQALAKNIRRFVGVEMRTAGLDS